MKEYPTMKYVLPMVGVALALSLSGTAYAADHDRNNRFDRGRDDAVTRQSDNRTPVVQQEQRRWQGQRFDQRRDRARTPVVEQEQRRWQGQRFDNDRWRNQTSRSNWQPYRRSYDAPRRFRVGVYHGPRGFHYRRWSYGERLPSIYYARPFWLLNAIAYGLFTPPPGLIWVRYGDDALLVDQYTGEIVQVRYNVFY